MAKPKITGDALEVAKINLAELNEKWQKECGQKLTDYVPKVTEVDTYNKLIRAVQEASQANENIGAFHNRVRSLGDAAIGLARTLGILV